MASECFVYITLPGTVDPVTAARFELSTTSNGDPLGRFVYGKSYLDRPDAVPFDPVELHLTNRVYETVAMKGVFGALRDLVPTGGVVALSSVTQDWQLSELNYLLQSSDDRAGALGFGLGQKPPAPKRAFNKRIDLERLQMLADGILANDTPAGDAEKAQAEELLLAGSSMGGARPEGRRSRRWRATHRQIQFSQGRQVEPRMRRTRDTDTGALVRAYRCRQQSRVCRWSRRSAGQAF